jgi:putative transcriptional regulator
MIRRHPDDELLLGLAAGTLDRAAAIVVAAHVEACASCGESAALLEAVGGECLAAIEPAALSVEAFGRTLAKIDASRRALPAVRPARHRPDAPAGMPWPRSLEGCEISPWKSIGPGMRWSRVRVPGQPDANAFLLRMGAGKELALHTHDGRELTQVLHGAFRDERGVWRAGDLDDTDATVRHRPVVTEEDECICLVAVAGRVRFDGWIARALGAWMGI